MLTLSRFLFSLVVVVWLPPLFTCWKAVACFLARPFPHSHRRPLAARKEDGGEGEGGSCSLHKKDQDNKKQNQNYFQTRGTWALLIEQWASWVALSCSSQLGGVITSPGTAALTLMWTVLRHIWDLLETMKDKYQLIGKIWCHLMFKGLSWSESWNSRWHEGVSDARVCGNMQKSGGWLISPVSVWGVAGQSVVQCGSVWNIVAECGRWQIKITSGLLRLADW